MPQWKDTTAYDKYADDNDPRTWSLNAGGLRIAVTTDHSEHKGVWVMHCEPFYHKFPLHVETAQEAKASALRLVRQQMADVMAALDDVDA
jgi:hypothetical protein